MRAEEILGRIAALKGLVKYRRNLDSYQQELTLDEIEAIMGWNKEEDPFAPEPEIPFIPETEDDLADAGDVLGANE